MKNKDDDIQVSRVAQWLSFLVWSVAQQQAAAEYAGTVQNVERARAERIQRTQLLKLDSVVLLLLLSSIS